MAGAPAQPRRIPICKHTARFAHVTVDIQAAGAVLIREGSSGELEYAVIHRPHRLDWTLPKGKLDPGEVLPQTAVREVDEETGLHITLGAPLATQTYEVAGQSKSVNYWRANTIAGDFHVTDEVDELRWLPAVQARALLTYDHDKQLIDEAGAVPTTSPLLLIRHAHAGDGAKWLAAGKSDDVRPLTERGLRAVPVIATIAHAFGVQQVHTSPAVRCTQTAEGLRAFATWHEEPLLREGVLVETPRFSEWLERVCQDPTPTAICAHGDTLDWLIGHFDLDPFQFTKGGLLVIHRDSTQLDRIVATEWYAAPR